jgi:hypothetical protein
MMLSDQRRIAGFVDGCGIEPPFHLIANSATFPLAPLRCGSCGHRAAPETIASARAQGKPASWQH